MIEYYTVSKPKRKIHHGERKYSKKQGGYFVYKIIPRSPYTNSEATEEEGRAF